MTHLQQGQNVFLPSPKKTFPRKVVFLFIFTILENKGRQYSIECLCKSKPPFSKPNPTINKGLPFAELQSTL